MVLTVIGLTVPGRERAVGAVHEEREDVVELGVDALHVLLRREDVVDGQLGVGGSELDGQAGGVTASSGRSEQPSSGSRQTGRGRRRCSPTELGPTTSWTRPLDMTTPQASPTDAAGSSNSPAALSSPVNEALLTVTPGPTSVGANWSTVVLRIRQRTDRPRRGQRHLRHSHHATCAEHDGENHPHPHTDSRPLACGHAPSFSRAVHLYAPA